RLTSSPSMLLPVPMPMLAGGCGLTTKLENVTPPQVYVVPGTETSVTPPPQRVDALAIDAMKTAVKPAISRSFFILSFLRLFVAMNELAVPGMLVVYVSVRRRVKAQSKVFHLADAPPKVTIKSHKIMNLLRFSQTRKIRPFVLVRTRAFGPFFDPEFRSFC